jgi:hypothetical protein
MLLQVNLGFQRMQCSRNASRWSREVQHLLALAAVVPDDATIQVADGRALTSSSSMTGVPALAASLFEQAGVETRRVGRRCSPRRPSRPPDPISPTLCVCCRAPLTLGVQHTLLHASATWSVSNYFFPIPLIPKLHTTGSCMCNT